MSYFEQIAQGAPASSLAGYWPVAVTDGTNLLFSSSHPAYIQGAVSITGTVTTTITGTVGVTQSTSPWVISGTVAATQSGTWNIGTVTAVTAITNPLPAGTNVIGHVITDSGSTTIITGTVAVTQSTSPWVVSNGGTFAVQSTLQAGSALVGQIEVSDGTNILFTSSHPGYIQGSVTATVASTTITGTVAVTQSTSPWVVSNGGTFAVQSTLQAGSNLVGQIEISDGTNVLFTSAHPGYVQGTVSIGSGPFATTDNITEWATTSLGAPTAFGTEPSGNVIGVNAEVFQGSSVVGSGNPLYVQFATAQAVTLTSTTITGSVAVTGTFYQATQPVSIASGQVASGAFASGSIASGAIASGAVASGAIASGAIASGAFASGSIGSTAAFSGTSSTAAFPDGSVYVRSNSASTFPVTASIAAAQTIAVTNAGTFAVQDTPATSGGLSTNVQTALTDTAVQVKSSAGQLYGVSVVNPATNAGIVYVLYYNTSSVTVGSTTPLLVVGVPAGGALTREISLGIAFSTTIYVIASTSVTSAAAPTTGLVVTSEYF